MFSFILKTWKHIWSFSWKQIKTPFPLCGTNQGNMSNTKEKLQTKVVLNCTICSLKVLPSRQLIWRKMFPVKWLIKTSMDDFITSLNTKKCTYWLFKYNWMIRKKLWLLLRERNIWKLQKEISAVLDPFCEYTKSLSSAFLSKGLRLGIQKNYLVTYRMAEMLHMEYKNQF